MSYNYLFKLILVGACSVGKTCLVDAWCNRPFSSEFNSTIGVEFAAKNIIFDNHHIKMHLWDTAGQEKFANIISTYYRGCAGAFVVFDVTKRTSFNKLNYWIQEIKNNNKDDEDIPIVIIGTKIDKPNRNISFDEAKQFAEINGYQYIETSSKKHINTEESFELLVKLVYDKINHEEVDDNKLPQGIRRGAMKFKKLGDNKNRDCNQDSWGSCCCIG
tara:strand:- start:2886 stop:3536 length:651 start_codon:yes stop_codon:yes gene_type:complete